MKIENLLYLSALCTTPAIAQDLPEWQDPSNRLEGF